MIDALKFVQGAVAKKDFAPVLTHFHIHAGRVLGYNGSLALSSPIELDFTCSPQAAELVKSLQLCGTAISVTQLPNGSLAIKSGKFKTVVQSSTDPYPTVEPIGHSVAIPGELLPVLEVLRPFISEDASRPWSRGILLRANSAWATNNVVVVQRWMGYGFPVDVNLSAATVDELLRIGEEPIAAQLEISEADDTSSSITFHFKDHRWLKSDLLSTAWPASVGPLLDGPAEMEALPDELWDALKMIKSFTDASGAVFLSPGAISTCQNMEDGTVIEVRGLTHKGIFGWKYLSQLEKVVEAIDLTAWPRPCLFKGDKLRGAIIGRVK